LRPQIRSVRQYFIYNDGVASRLQSPVGTYFAVGPCVTSHGLSNELSQIVCDDFEVNGAAFLDNGFQIPDQWNATLGTGSNNKQRWDTNSGGDDLFVSQSISGGGDSEALFYSNLDPNGMTDHNGYISPTFVISNSNGADAGDYAGLVMGERAQANVAVNHYFDFYAMTGSVDGSVDATTTELAPIFRFGSNPTASTHSLGPGDTVFNNMTEFDNTAYFDGMAIHASAVLLNNNVDVRLGNTSDAGFFWSTGQTNPSTIYTVGNTSHMMLLVEKADQGFDFAHPNQTNPTLFIHSANQATDEWLGLSHDQTDAVLGAGTGGIKIGGVRFKEVQGADVASANDLTLGTDGNSFEVTGATDINRIAGAGWENGNEIVLYFSGSLNVVHGVASGGGFVTILLPGGSNFGATANDVLCLKLGEIGGTQAWRQTCRTAIP
jgi:hypothetical protein